VPFEALCCYAGGQDGEKPGERGEDIAQNGGKGYLGFLGVLKFCQDVSRAVSIFHFFRVSRDLVSTRFRKVLQGFDEF
jgi:hypothetical protein